MADVSKDEIKKVLNNRPKSHLETYQSEITDYIASKLENYNVPICTVMEIAQYCYQATLLTANNEVRRAYRLLDKHERKKR